MKIYLPPGASFPSGATHLWMLLRAALRTDGPILEYGAGMYSTPILAEVAAAQGRPFVTVEESSEWARFARQFAPEVIEGPYEQTREATHQRFEHAGVVFVDHADGARMIEFAYWTAHADVVVLHDAGPDVKVYQPYPNIYLDERLPPETVVSSAEPRGWAA